MARPVTYHVIRSLPSPRMASEHVPFIIISTEGGLFLKEAYEFFHDDRYISRSHSWRMGAAKTIGLFYDFFKASEAQDLDEAVNQNQLVRKFLLAMGKGTIQSNGDDIYGLRWKPTTSELYSARKAYLRDFLDALCDLVSENCVIPTRFCEVSISSRAYEHSRNRSLLYNVRKPGRRSSEENTGRSIGVIHKKTPFDPDALIKLLEVGCRRRRSIPEFYDNRGNPTLASEFNLNLLMAVLLMAGGGIRQSEVLHIFLEDIRPDVVWMYHPEAGIDRSGVKRVDYLRDEFGLLPRTRVSGSQHSGWKSFLITDAKKNRSRLFMLPHFKELFYQAFQEYRRYIYPNNPGHPYLFVSMDRRFYGQPWTVQGLKDAFATGMKRVGIRQSKYEDTNIHALRHGYGQTLVSMKLSPLYIQEAMHHTSIESQKVYTRPSDAQINEKLKIAAGRMQAIMDGTETDLPTLEVPDLIWGKYNSDPAGIFTPQILGRGNDRV